MFEKTSLYGWREAGLKLRKIKFRAFTFNCRIHVIRRVAKKRGGIENFRKTIPTYRSRAVLRDSAYSKKIRTLEQGHSRLPEMYALGRKQQRLGCVKSSTSPTYWQRIRRNFRRSVLSAAMSC